jgi:hypothetical protein
MLTTAGWRGPNVFNFGTIWPGFNQLKRSIVSQVMMMMMIVLLLPKTEKNLKKNKSFKPPTRFFKFDILNSEIKLIIF